MSVDPGTIAWAADTGLVPAIVQDRADGRVLMLAWMDRESLAATLTTGQVHFHSRSRDRLWRKGETSGNVLNLHALEVDCDGDALLLLVDPIGPTCHRDTRSCFDQDSSADPAALARWMTRLKRAFNSVQKIQQRLIRIERNIARLED